MGKVCRGSITAARDIAVGSHQLLQGQITEMTVRATEDEDEDGPHLFHLNAVDHEHMVEFREPFSYEALRVSQAVLTEEVEQWIAENTPSATVTLSKAWNFGVDVSFANDRDAVLFKLRWL